jgi:hypothetical protein
MKIHKIIIKLLLLGYLFFSWQYLYAQIDSNEKSDQIRLNLLLKKTSQYCRKLDNAAFFYVCHEEVTEKIHHSLFLDQEEIGKLGRLDDYRVGTEKNKYLYEYQLIRKKGKTEEKRTLLERNGRKVLKKDAKLETLNFYFRNILFGPVTLLGEQRQHFYDYKLHEGEIHKGESTFVIEAMPKSHLKQHHPYGRIWIRKSDFAILKIEWDYRSISSPHIIEKRAKNFKAEPHITLISEFDIEKNGIRFPNRFIFEEVYIKGQKKKIVKSETTIIYKDYRFFTVEVEIKHK